MESKAKAALNRLKEIDKKYKYKQDKLKISSDSSRSSNDDKVQRPILSIKLPDPYEEYVDSNTDDDDEHVAVRIVDDTPKEKSERSSDSSSEDTVSKKEDEEKSIEDLSDQEEEISEIIEDVSETVQELTDKSFGNLSLGDRIMTEDDDKRESEKKDSDEIITDRYSDSFESSGSNISAILSVEVKKSTSESQNVETKSDSVSSKSSRSVKSKELTEKLLSKVESEKKLSSDSVEDRDGNKLVSLDLVENNLLDFNPIDGRSENTEEKSSNSKYESSKSSSRSSNSSSHKSVVEKSKKTSETSKSVSDNELTVPTTESDDYISEPSETSSHKSIIKKSKQSSDSRQTVSDHEFIISKSENKYSGSERSFRHKAGSYKSKKKKTDIRQIVSDYEEYSSSKKKCYKSSKSRRSLEEKIRKSHRHFEQEQKRLNSAMINYIQKMEEEHQRLLMWPKNLICPSRVNLKTVKPLELPNISGFVRPDAKPVEGEDINMEILRNRLLDIRQWLKDQYLIYREHCDLAVALNKTYTS